MSQNAMSQASAPPSPVGRAYRALDGLLEHTVVALVLASAAIAVVQVFFRYVLNSSLAWPEEVAQWGFVWAVFLGLPLLTGRDGHISIRLVSTLLGPTGKAALAHFGRVITAAASVMLIVHGFDFIGRVLQVSPAMQWPLKYLFAAVPVAAALNLVYIARPTARARFSGLIAVLLGGLIYLAVIEAAPSLFGRGSPAPILLTLGFTLIFLEVPIAFAMVFGATTAFAAQGPLMLVIVSQHMGAALNSFTILAIPFFITAAATMNAGGISTRLVDLATHLVGHFRGGLGQANVVTNVMLAGVSGSSTADASAISKLMVPEMERRGYSRPFSCALTAASSTLANMIPPGLGLIIYAALASVSVGALFVATIVPGLLAATALALVVWLVSRRQGYGADTPRHSWAERRTAFWYAIPALLLPVFIVGGVRFGVFTATEAGAMALVFAILCGALIYRGLTARNFLDAIKEACGDTVAVAVVIAAAAPFAWVLASEQVPQKIAGYLGGFSDHAVLLLILINLFLLVVGLFMEMIAAMVILVPILVPLTKAAGIDPVHFGIVLVMNLVLGALTPPLGVLVFTTARVGGAPPTRVFRAILPFIGALLVVLILVTYLTALTLLPVALFGP